MNADISGGNVNLVISGTNGMHILPRVERPLLARSRKSSYYEESWGEIPQITKLLERISFRILSVRALRVTDGIYNRLCSCQQDLAKFHRFSC